MTRSIIFSIQKFVLFCKKLRILLETGIDLEKGLQILIKDEKDAFYQSKLKKMLGNISAGKPFIFSLNTLLPKLIKLPCSDIE